MLTVGGGVAVLIVGCDDDGMVGGGVAFSPVGRDVDRKVGGGVVFWTGGGALTVGSGVAF